MSLRFLVPLGVMLLGFACGRIEVEDSRPCPCTAGYFCCSATNLCVADEKSCASTAREPVPEAGADAPSVTAPCDDPVVREPSDPTLWRPAGNGPDQYVMNVDPGTTFLSRPYAHVQSRSADVPVTTFGTLTSSLKLARYLGKRVRMSAILKGANITGWAGLWLRVDGPDKKSLAFDNMQNRPVVGTTSANRYQIELDVDPTAVSIYYGVLLSGSGEIWAGDPAFEIVERSQPYVLDANAWLATGESPEEYDIGPITAGRCGVPDGYIRSRGQAPVSGALLQSIAADGYRGRRVKMSGYMRTSKISGGAGLWLRVDAEDGSVLASDNMQRRLLSGTTALRQTTIVLDVPQTAKTLFFGMQLAGSGEAWVDGVRFDVVDVSVPTTD
jgi:hypothetical protein